MASAVAKTAMIIRTELSFRRPLSSKVYAAEGGKSMRSEIVSRVRKGPKRLTLRMSGLVGKQK